MGKVLFAALFLSVFILVSCDSGTKKETDMDLGISDTDVINDEEIKDDDFPVTDHDSPLTDHDSPLTDHDSPLTDHDSPLTDDDEQPDDAFTPEEYEVEGFVQKGPFIKDSSITITELDHNFEMIPATTFTTQTVDDLGNFNVKRTFSSRYILLEAKGFYYNEVSGSISSTQITNYVFVDLKANNSKISINILTTLARRRIQHLMKQGLGFNEARLKAEKEVLEIFGIFGEPFAKFQDMDILKAGNSNGMLLAISARLQGDNTPGDLSSLVADIIYDIETNGELNDSSLKLKISNGSVFIAQKLTDIRDNLEDNFKTKTTVDLPDFENYCDDSGNGIINKWDYDLDFGSFEGGEIATPYISKENIIKVNSATTAVAKTDFGTIVINGVDTGLSEFAVNDGDELAVKIISSNDWDVTLTSNITIEYSVTDGYTKGLSKSGYFSVTTGCINDDIRTAHNVCGEENSGTQQQKCVNRLWVGFGDCTRIYNCPAKPKNAQWHSVSSYSQTWDGDDWFPENLQSKHTMILDNNPCSFKCSEAGTAWNGISCGECSGDFPDKFGGYCWSNVSSNQMFWATAGLYCQDMGGRLPTISELRLLVKNCPAIQTGGSCLVTDSCLNYGDCRVDECAGCESAPDYSGKYSALEDTVYLCSSSLAEGYPDYVYYLDYSLAYLSTNVVNAEYRARCVR
jgi:hypothetical protein